MCSCSVSSAKWRIISWQICSSLFAETPPSIILYSVCHPQLWQLQKCLPKRQSPIREKAAFNLKELTNHKLTYFQELQKQDDLSQSGNISEAYSAGNCAHSLCFHIISDSGQCFGLVFVSSFNHKPCCSWMTPVRVERRAFPEEIPIWYDFLCRSWTRLFRYIARRLEKEITEKYFVYQTILPSLRLLLHYSFPLVLIIYSLPYPVLLPLLFLLFTLDFPSSTQPQTPIIDIKLRWN